MLTIQIKLFDNWQDSIAADAAAPFACALVALARGVVAGVTTLINGQRLHVRRQDDHFIAAYSTIVSEENKAYFDGPDIYGREVVFKNDDLLDTIDHLNAVALEPCPAITDAVTALR